MHVTSIFAALLYSRFYCPCECLENKTLVNKRRFTVFQYVCKLCEQIICAQTENVSANSALMIVQLNHKEILLKINIKFKDSTTRCVCETLMPPSPNKVENDLDNDKLTLQAMGIMYIIM